MTMFNKNQKEDQQEELKRIADVFQKQLEDVCAISDSVERYSAMLQLKNDVAHQLEDCKIILDKKLEKQGLVAGTSTSGGFLAMLLLAEPITGITITIANAIISTVGVPLTSYFYKEILGDGVREHKKPYIEQLESFTHQVTLELRRLEGERIVELSQPMKALFVKGASLKEKFLDSRKNKQAPIQDNLPAPENKQKINKP
jgi:hypothetical protein